MRCISMELWNCKYEIEWVYNIFIPFTHRPILFYLDLFFVHIFCIKKPKTFHRNHFHFMLFVCVVVFVSDNVHHVHCVLFDIVLNFVNSIWMCVRLYAKCPSFLCLVLPWLALFHIKSYTFVLIFFHLFYYCI